MTAPAAGPGLARPKGVRSSPSRCLGSGPSPDGAVGCSGGACPARGPSRPRLTSPGEAPSWRRPGDGGSHRQRRGPGGRQNAGGRGEMLRPPPIGAPGPTPRFPLAVLRRHSQCRGAGLPRCRGGSGGAGERRREGLWRPSGNGGKGRGRRQLLALGVPLGAVRALPRWTPNRCAGVGPGRWRESPVPRRGRCRSWYRNGAWRGGGSGDGAKSNGGGVRVQGASRWHGGAPPPPGAGCASPGGASPGPVRGAGGGGGAAAGAGRRCCCITGRGWPWGGQGAAAVGCRGWGRRRVPEARGGWGGRCARRSPRGTWAWGWGAAVLSTEAKKPVPGVKAGRCSSHWDCKMEMMGRVSHLVFIYLFLNVVFFPIGMPLAEAVWVIQQKCSVSAVTCSLLHLVFSCSAAWSALDIDLE